MLRENITHITHSLNNQSIEDPKHKIYTILIRYRYKLQRISELSLCASDGKYGDEGIYHWKNGDCVCGWLYPDILWRSWDGQYLVQSRCIYFLWHFKAARSVAKNPRVTKWRWGVQIDAIKTHHTQHNVMEIVVQIFGKRSKNESIWWLSLHHIRIFCCFWIIKKKTYHKILRQTVVFFKFLILRPLIQEREERERERESTTKKNVCVCEREEKSKNQKNNHRFFLYK